MEGRASGTRVLDALIELLSELPARVGGGRERLSEEVVSGLRKLVEELDLVTREEYDELELRVAQLEHRLRLLEQPRPVDLPPAG